MKLPRPPEGWHRLILTRHLGEAVVIDGPARVLWAGRGRADATVRLVIDAPLETHVLREELER